MRLSNISCLFGLVFLLVLSSDNVICVGDRAQRSRDRGRPSRSARSSSPDLQVTSNFIQKYNIVDPANDKLMTERQYIFLAKEAYLPIDRVRAYNSGWSELRNAGKQRLFQKGRGYPYPRALYKHRQYADFFDGRYHTPTLFLRVADIAPDNPMGKLNPDVAVFMHTVRISHLTYMESNLELRYILRGILPQEGASPGPEMRIVWRKAKTYSGTWLDKVPDPYKHSVLSSLERLGYNPRTIEREIVAHAQARHKNVYLDMERSRIASFLEASQKYFSQFDVPGEAKRFQEYCLVVGIDHPGQPRGPWFVTPVFANFDPKTGQTETEMYWAAGERLISLDRIRFKAALDVDGKIALIPTAIVRPIQAVPAVRLETVYLIPPDLQEKHGYRFNSYQPKTEGRKNDPDYYFNPTDPPKDAYIFGIERPRGHPLDSVELGSSRTDAAERAMDRIAPDARVPAPDPVSRAVESEKYLRKPKEERERFARAEEVEATPLMTWGRSDQVHSGYLTPTVESFGYPPHLLAPSPNIPARASFQLEAEQEHMQLDSLPTTPQTLPDSNVETPSTAASKPTSGQPVQLDNSPFAPHRTSSEHQERNPHYSPEQHLPHEHNSAMLERPSPPRPIHPESLYHLPSPAQPRHLPEPVYHYHFQFKPGQPNPYEQPHEDVMEVLTSHFKPKLEDIWRYRVP